MVDSQEVPRFAGMPSFMRLPHKRDLEGVDADVAFLGVPYDDATSYRPGARFGPRAIRNASTLLKPYNPVTGTDLKTKAIIDHDDAKVIPGYTEETFDQIEARVSYVLENGVAPAIAGGDHSVTLPVLRAIANEHGPVSLVQFDAHSDLWTEYFGEDHNHGTTVHYAIEEGLIEPETSIRIGDRGGLYNESDTEMIEDSGIEYYPIETVDDEGIGALADRVGERTEGPTFATIDIDGVDPAFAPGTGTPAPGGFSAREIIRLTRALHDCKLVGFDLVEVSPPYDQSNVTAILAANLMFEAICALVD